MGRVIRGGLVQVRADVSLEGTAADIKQRMIDKHLPLIEEAARQGVQLLCLQELFNGPYFCAEQQPRWYEMVERIPDGPTIRLMQCSWCPSGTGVTTSSPSMSSARSPSGVSRSANQSSRSVCVIDPAPWHPWNAPPAARRNGSRAQLVRRNEGQADRGIAPHRGVEADPRRPVHRGCRRARDAGRVRHADCRLHPERRAPLASPSRSARAPTWLTASLRSHAVLHGAIKPESAASLRRPWQRTVRDSASVRPSAGRGAARLHGRARWVEVFGRALRSPF